MFNSDIYLVSFLFFFPLARRNNSNIKSRVLLIFRASNAFIFYGLSLNSTSFSGNKYLNFILICLVEIPGYTFSWITMNKIGRRWSLAGSLLLCALSCIAGGFAPQGLFIYELSAQNPKTYFISIITFQIGLGWSQLYSWWVNWASHPPSQPSTCTQLKCCPQ